jgi:outer membrane protein assembly factor BamD (BamD/ComL family)
VSLAEDAHARLVEAHARAGDAEAAKSAATRYRTLYPEGRRLADVNRWIGEDP